MTASLWFDDLNFLLSDAAEEAAALAADGYFFEAGGKDDGTKLTNAEAIVSSVASDLFDGSSHEVTGWESATLTLKVEIASPAWDGLTAGQARLIATCRRDGIRPLTLTPGSGTPTVYDVIIATWEHQYDDLDNELHRRGYLLTLLCKPFARSDVAVSLPGLAVGGAYSETVIATGSSTTNWSTTSRYVTRRNMLVTPSFENGTSISPWTTSTGTVSNPKPVVVTDGAAPDPTHVLKVTTSGLVSGGKSYMVSGEMPVTPGVSYPLLSRVKGGHSAMNLAGLLVRFYNGSGSQVGTDDHTTVALTTSSYATLSVSKTAPTGATRMRIFPYVQANATVASGQVWYLDAAAAIDLKTVATTTFFDGDNAPSGGLVYYWGSAQGTAGISIETALGGVTASGGVVFPRGSSSTVPVVNVPGIGVNLTYTASINVTSHRYVRVKATTTVSLKLDGISATLVATGNSGDYVICHFAVPDSITTSAATATVSDDGAEWAQSSLPRVAEIATTSHPTAGTGRTISRAVALVGSMPAEAAIEVTNNGNVLGDHLIVHSGSRPGGFLPLRAYRTAGPAQSSSASSISGFLSTMNSTQGSSDTFQIPVGQLSEATYLFSAYLDGSLFTVGNTYTINYQTSIIEDPSGTPVEHSIVTGSWTMKATLANPAAQPYNLALVNLPATYTAVTGTNSAVVQIQLWAPNGVWVLDEAWLADIDNGQISVVDFSAAGLSGKVNSLEIIPAAADHPQQQYLAYSGTSPNQTVREIIPTGWAAHRFDPADGDAQVNVVNTATTPGLSVAIEFFPRWDVFAAPITTGEDA